MIVVFLVGPGFEPRPSSTIFFIGPGFDSQARSPVSGQCDSWPMSDKGVMRHSNYKNATTGLYELGCIEPVILIVGLI